MFFKERFFFFYLAFLLLSFFAVIVIMGNRLSPGYKLAWIILIMVFPVFGGTFYFLFSKDQIKKKFLEDMQQINEGMTQNLPMNTTVSDELRAISKQAVGQSDYISQHAHSPLYAGTPTKYYKLGEDKFEDFLLKLKDAKRYIFLEYFIIGEGKMWNNMLEILRQKADSGIDVRVIYDDFGCLLTLPSQYYEKLESYGIKCAIFNPIKPLLSLRMNNRNHRKMLIIDGEIAFTGGINIADEYINHIERFGHWKDTGIMVTGEAVWSFVVMFLTMWRYLKDEDIDFDAYRNVNPFVEKRQPVRKSAGLLGAFCDVDGDKPVTPFGAVLRSDGFVQPFADSPLDFENTSETVYLNLINQAVDYVWITTPYLILDNMVASALSAAVKRGVEVKILTPFKPDKWYVHAMTRANYRFLLEDGVRIFEYTPGFMHAKMIVVDDEYAVIGTVNLDYRSLYLHYECAVWLYRNSAISEIRGDILETLGQSEEIMLEKYQDTPLHMKALFAFLRIFAPLM